MNRIEELRHIVDQILWSNKNVDEQRLGFVHLYGVAQACDLIARKRGLNQEIAVMAGMLHDIYRYKHEYTLDHGQQSALLARGLLLNIADENEIDIICTAISNHSEKTRVDDDYSELLKDADVFQHCSYNPFFSIEEREVKRFVSLLSEFALKVDDRIVM